VFPFADYKNPNLGTMIFDEGNLSERGNISDFKYEV
jgi:hypothetical protein